LCLKPFDHELDKLAWRGSIGQQKGAGRDVRSRLLSEGLKVSGREQKAAHDDASARVFFSGLGHGDV
jgi:hypothetical protein